MHHYTLFLLFQLLEVSQLDIISRCLWVYGAFKLPKPLMPLRKVTIVLSQFPLGKWIVLLTSDCGRQFIKSSESKERDDGVWCCGPPKLNGFGTVAPYVGGTLGVAKVAAVSVEELRYSVAWCNVSLDWLRYRQVGWHQMGLMPEIFRRMGKAKREQLGSVAELRVMYFRSGAGE